VVDLSADFRLRDRAHLRGVVRRARRARPVRRGVYGLPELYRESLAGAELVANPGCYPDRRVLGLAPLAREN
jgi:N-acetyl-gamma-glutamyl-phosphate reductase